MIQTCLLFGRGAGVRTYGPQFKNFLDSVVCIFDCFTQLQRVQHNRTGRSPSYGWVCVSNLGSRQPVQKNYQVVNCELARHERLTDQEDILLIPDRHLNGALWVCSTSMWCRKRLLASVFIFRVQNCEIFLLYQRWYNNPHEYMYIYTLYVHIGLLILCTPKIIRYTMRIFGPFDIGRWRKAPCGSSSSGSRWSRSCCSPSLSTWTRRTVSPETSSSTPSTCARWEHGRTRAPATSCRSQVFISPGSFIESSFALIYWYQMFCVTYLFFCQTLKLCMIAQLSQAIMVLQKMYISVYPLLVLENDLDSRRNIASTIEILLWRHPRKILK